MSFKSFSALPLGLLGAILLLAQAGAAEPKYDAVVAADGSGTQTNVQNAVNAAPEDGKKPFVIFIKPGIYHEHVVVPASKPFIRFMGDPARLEQTVITEDTNFKTPGPEGRSLNARDSSTVLEQAADFSALNITFENTTTRDAHVQALAMYVEADRAVFRHCRFLGWQDTLRADKPRTGIGRQYFRDCYIEGHVDFIYAAGTAVFDHCHIHAKADGYLTAASTLPDAPFGYVFLDCQVTAGPDVQQGFYLGRPWRPHAAVAFIRCELPGQVRPEGWHNWNNTANEATARYSEYKSTGPGARPEARCQWSKQLTDDEAKAYTVENVLKGEDGWKPGR